MWDCAKVMSAQMDYHADNLRLFELQHMKQHLAACSSCRALDQAYRSVVHWVGEQKHHSTGIPDVDSILVALARKTL
jgi:predicted anti-sigma-YlaC factor YlaD